MLKFFDVEQNTDEWMAMRAGKLTSSSLGKVMANYGKAFGEPAKKLAAEIALGQITGVPLFDSYSNDHMERGHEQEPIARALYEQQYFCDVSNGGFFCNDILGCSPDGVVMDGVIEIKSVIPHVHTANIQRGWIDPAYKWQCYANLYFTGSQWIDFVSYCADFPRGKQLYVCRIERNAIDAEAEQLTRRIDEFMPLIADKKNVILNGSYSQTYSQERDE